MTDSIISLIDGRAGRISLNRPEAIHALTLDMVQAMTRALTQWRSDPGVEIVMIDHHRGRGFCAGGDVVAIGRSTDRSAMTDFFFHEYRLNHQLFTYEKPTAAFMDGIVMGGGVGIARPCRYRIATDRTLFAMPETSIGLFPDVGGGWYLSRLIGRRPQFLALTGARLDGSECFALGLATHYVPHEAIEALKAAIARDPDRVEALLADAHISPPPARIRENRERIDRLFAASTLEAIMADLEADGSEWADKELATLRKKSPTSCKVSLRLLERGREMRNFADEMAMEYALVAKVTRLPDFAEGVRALLVDKDGKPVWQPGTPEAVTDAMVESLFEPLPPGQGWTPLEQS